MYRSGGTVFYLYSPFSGSILTDVLSALRIESTCRVNQNLFTRSLHPRNRERDMAEAKRTTRYGAHRCLQLSISTEKVIAVFVEAAGFRDC